MPSQRIGPKRVEFSCHPSSRLCFRTEPTTLRKGSVTLLLSWCRPISMVSKSDVTLFLYHCFCSDDTEISCHPTSEVHMLENSCHPISIPPETWLSPYFHASILSNWLSPYFQGPGCHPTSVVLFLFSRIASLALFY